MERKPNKLHPSKGSMKLEIENEDEPDLETPPAESVQSNEPSAQTVVQVPLEVESPIEAPAKEPPEEPSEAPVEEPAVAPMEEPVSAPAEASVEDPAVAPVSAPVEEPASAPVEELVSAPAATTPVEASVSAPGGASFEAPIHAPPEEPVEAPAEAPPAGEPEALPIEHLQPEEPPGVLEPLPIRNPFQESAEHDTSKSLRNSNGSVSDEPIPEPPLTPEQRAKKSRASISSHTRAVLAEREKIASRKSSGSSRSSSNRSSISSLGEEHPKKPALRSSRRSSVEHGPSHHITFNRPSQDELAKLEHDNIKSKRVSTGGTTDTTDFPFRRSTSRVSFKSSRPRLSVEEAGEPLPPLVEVIAECDIPADDEPIPEEGGPIHEDAQVPPETKAPSASEMSIEQLQLAVTYHSGPLESEEASQIFVDNLMFNHPGTSKETIFQSDGTFEDSPEESRYLLEAPQLEDEDEDGDFELAEGKSGEGDYLSEFTMSQNPSTIHTPGPLPLSLCHTPVSGPASEEDLIPSHLSVVDLACPPMSPWQRGPTDDEKCAFTRSYGRIFNHLNVTDVKSARQVCSIWHLYSGPAFKAKTVFVFNPEDVPVITTVANAILNPWLLLLPEKSNNFLGFIQNSQKKLSPWASLRVMSATTTDIKFLIEDKTMEAELRRAVRSITSLEMNTCFIEWKTLFRFLHCFSHLEELIDIHNVYYEPVPFHIQLIETFKGGWTSPQTHHTQMDHAFIKTFAKYRFRWKRLKIQDTGLSTNTPLFMFILRETILPESLEELELIAGGECMSCEKRNGMESVHFWIATGELLLNFGATLKKLTIRCTHENALTTSFDQFVGSSIEYLNQTNSNGNMRALTHLTLDFSFLWLSHALVEKEFIPFITKLELLKHLSLRTIVMRPNYGQRLEGLKPLLPNCYYDLGVHVTDLEGGHAVPHVIKLVESSLYQTNMRTLNVSIHCPETVRLQQVMTSREEITYDNLKSFTLSIMNQHFEGLNIQILPVKFPELTELTIIDGPTLHYLVGEYGLLADKQYSRMSRVVFKDLDLQFIFQNFPNLRILHLQLNMENVTDTGMTGITAAAIKRMDFGKYLQLHDPEYEITGHSFGDMIEIRSIIMKGLGPWITDVTAKLGFLGLKKLETLILGGKQRMSKDGKAQLMEMFPKSRGCTVKFLGQ